MSLSPDDLTQVQDALKRVSFYDALTPGELEELGMGFEKHAMTKGETLITQGKAGGIFYILSSGSVGVFQSGKFLDTKIATIGPGSFFGEMALLNNDPRSANVVCEEEGVAFTLTQATFQKVILRNPKIAQLVRQTAGERKHKNREIELNRRTGKNPA